MTDKDVTAAKQSDIAVNMSSRFHMGDKDATAAKQARRALLQKSNDGMDVLLAKMRKAAGDHPSAGGAAYLEAADTKFAPVYDATKGFKLATQAGQQDYMKFKEAVDRAHGLNALEEEKRHVDKATAAMEKLESLSLIAKTYNGLLYGFAQGCGTRALMASVDHFAMQDEIAGTKSTMLYCIFKSPLDTLLAANKETNKKDGAVQFNAASLEDFARMQVELKLCPDKAFERAFKEFTESTGKLGFVVVSLEPQMFAFASIDTPSKSSIAATAAAEVAAELKKAPEDTKIEYLCSNCGNPGTEKKPLKKCTQCRCNEYCSRKCQKADWPKHKAGCLQRQNTIGAFERAV